MQLEKLGTVSAAMASHTDEMYASLVAGTIHVNSDWVKYLPDLKTSSLEEFGRFTTMPAMPWWRRSSLENQFVLYISSPGILVGMSIQGDPETIPLSNDRELLGQMDQATTVHAYPPTVWSAGEVVEDQVQISAANLQAGRSEVWMGLYSPSTQVRISVEAGAGEVIEDRTWLSEVQIGT